MDTICTQFQTQLAGIKKELDDLEKGIKNITIHGGTRSQRDALHAQVKLIQQKKEHLMKEYRQQVPTVLEQWFKMRDFYDASDMKADIQETGEVDVSFNGALLLVSPIPQCVQSLLGEAIWAHIHNLSNIRHIRSNQTVFHCSASVFYAEKLSDFQGEVLFRAPEISPAYERYNDLSQIQIFFPELQKNVGIMNFLLYNNVPFYRNKSISFYAPKLSECDSIHFGAVDSIRCNSLRKVNGFIETGPDIKSIKKAFPVLTDITQTNFRAQNSLADREKNMLIAKK
ncbi:hypothetical protein HGA88_02850 [Candidatus Roizmanbacteria bacterium]|nr:hypothetical protein [Candidatus Roizmanbacteria bacterium]